MRRRRIGFIALLVAALFAALTPTSPVSAQASDPNVDRLYCAYFLREADPGGQDYWNDLYRQGVSLEVIAEQFAASDEFRNTYGAQQSTADFVNLIYRNLFDRTPDAEGFAYWTNLLDTGQTYRGVVMTYFSLSEEFINRVNALGCGGTGGGTPADEATATPQVAGRLSALTNWDTPVKSSVDDRNDVLTGSISTTDTFRGRTVCRPQGLELMSRTFSEFPANAFSGPTLPGLIVEGAGIAEGDLRVLPLDRASFELLSTADSLRNVRYVRRPETSDIQQAVTALKRDADVRLSEDGVDIVDGDITFSKKEVFSYEQASLEVGISLHYDGLTRSAGFEGDFSQTTAEQQHSIAVSVFQPMFTISMELDDNESPGSFFADSVTTADLDRLAAQGRLGTDNPPVVIDTVTYGRIMQYTMTSTLATSARELSAVVDGSYRGVTGEASLTTRQQQVLASSTIQLIAYGGDQTLALNAIKSGDLGQYFGPANTATASPITMTMRTLDGKKVDVADEATLKRMVCDEVAVPYQFEVIVSSIQNGTVTVTTQTESRRIGRVASANEDTRAGAGDNNIVATIPADLLDPGWNIVWFTFDQKCLERGPEQFNASLRTRGTPGSGSWSTRQGWVRYSAFDCGTVRKSRLVNTLTGEIVTIVA